jgi:hypothetical protein
VRLCQRGQGSKGDEEASRHHFERVNTVREKNVVEQELITQQEMIAPYTPFPLPRNNRRVSRWSFN